jgi:hypothetical protein
MSLPCGDDNVPTSKNLYCLCVAEQLWETTLVVKQNRLGGVPAAELRNHKPKRFAGSPSVQLLTSLNSGVKDEMGTFQSIHRRMHFRDPQTACDAHLTSRRLVKRPIFYLATRSIDYSQKDPFRWLISRQHCGGKHPGRLLHPN